MVLRDIRNHFASQVSLLELPPTATDAMADRVCAHVAKLISEYTAILGFVLRSTNVRNAFELHHVMKSLVERVLGQNTYLLISSEWDFVPFTYPIGIDLLPRAVLLGSPAPESENPLIIPLAGHEIGHSAWRTSNVEDSLNEAVMSAVDDAIATKVGTPSSAENEQDRRAEISLMRDRCGFYALQQLEEIYCDLLGLYLFGPSYLYAFDYLLGPGGTDRYLHYPSDAKRMEILAATADQLAIWVDTGLRDRWTTAQCSQEDEESLAIIDHAVDATIDTLKSLVSEFVTGLGLAPPTGENIARVQAAFEQGQPYAETATLGEIISAGWSLLRSNGDLATDENRKSYKVLCDLIWKTIEVTEYLEKGPASDA